MIQLSHSPLLQALGYAIISSLWQFALLWLIYLFINSFIKLTSHHRYIGALTLQFVGFCWFVVTAIFYYGQCINNLNSGLDIQHGFSYLASSGSSLSLKQTIFSYILQAELFLPYLSVGYLIIITGLSFKVITAYKNTQQLRYNGLEKIDVKWRLFVKQISSQLGIKRNVRLFISTAIESPVTIGFLKPLILLPVAAVNNLTTDQIEAILVHEMAHIKRNDYIINILVSIVEVTLFFNPFMQLLSKQMKRERENSCDDWVLQYEYNACSYANALLKIATYKTTNTTSFAVNAVDNRRALLIRVKRMIEKKNIYNTYRQQLVSLIFLSTAISSIAWFTPKKYPEQSAKLATSYNKIVTEPLVAKVENPLFNPVFFLVDEDKKEVPPATSKSHKEKVNASIPVAAEPLKEKPQVAIIDEVKTSQIVKVSKQDLKEVHAVNLVLDSALFQNFATRTLVVSEIKKLKKEFEELNKSSMFQNVDWKQFWDNTKVQKQLESAFEQLKAIELEQKRKPLIINASNAATALVDKVMSEKEQLKIIAAKKLAIIVKERITDIKEQHNTSKVGTELNFNFDIPDFSQLNIPKDNTPGSYTYNVKPRVVQKPANAITHKISIKKTPCREVKPQNVTIDLAPASTNIEVIVERTRPATVPQRRIKVIKI